MTQAGLKCVMFHQYFLRKCFHFRMEGGYKLLLDTFLYIKTNTTTLMENYFWMKYLMNYHSHHWRLLAPSRFHCWSKSLLHFEGRSQTVYRKCQLYMCRSNKILRWEKIQKNEEKLGNALIMPTREWEADYGLGCK